MGDEQKDLLKEDLKQERKVERKRNKNEEQLIKNAILDYILMFPSKGFAWSQYNGAVYYPFIGMYRKRHRHARKGVPDICGVWGKDGKALLLEVKRPGGKVSPEQKRLLEEARKLGAIAHVVYSLQEAMTILDSFES